MTKPHTRQDTLVKEALFQPQLVRLSVLLGQATTITAKMYTCTLSNKIGRAASLHT